MTLRLTASFGAERRRLPRSPASGSVLATFSNDGRVGVAGIELIDSSACGLGVRSPLPATPGDLLGFHFDDTVLPSRLGRVVRCERDGDGYRIGLVAATAQAAA